ncbi:uncharacterized protein TNCT_280981 [Trichonephila clavata]|uniref:Peptidase aspartic putative domain-containing protein n=1 Tax=Trichonephila clavata TaxID=2740835 RepID=A0A8X6JKF8_TRICU|nr:uncharacterized protein TNCT_280981 [Trichonephila clavata]
MRMQTTKLFNKVETALLDETISLEEKFDLLSICKDQLNEKYETLKKLNSDIQDGIPDTEFENEIENSENYSERIIESRYKITKFLNERNVDNQSVVAESYGCLLCPIILKLIPSEIALDFNRKRLDYETFNVEELHLFLKKETESREATLSMQNSDQQIISSKKENFKHSPKYSNFRRGTPTASALTTNARNACVFCDNYEHDSISCKFISIPEKREKLRKEGRCYVCFRKFHVSSKCKFKLTPCKICHGNFHNTSILNKLTNESTLPKESNSDAPLATTAASHCKIDKKDVCNKEVVLQTIYVNVECERNSQTSLLLFDVGSQRTFVTSKLVSKLKAPIIRPENYKSFPLHLLSLKLKHLA